MAEPGGPKKETVRLTSELPTEPAPKKGDTVRFDRLPEAPDDSAPPMTPVYRPPAAPVRPPNLPRAPVIGAEHSTPTPAVPGITPAASPLVRPKQETARVSEVREAAPPTINMKKTQPLVKGPAAEIHHPPISVGSPARESFVDFIPRLLLWGLFAGSLVIFLLQLWNYFTL